MTYVIDTQNLAHMKACREIVGEASHYVVKIATNEELVEHLSKPDIKDRREAPGLVVPCEACLLP